MRTVDEILEELKGLGVPDNSLKPIRFWQRKRKKRVAQVEALAYKALVDDEAFIIAAQWNTSGELEQVTVCFRAVPPQHLNPTGVSSDLVVQIGKDEAAQGKWWPLVKKAESRLTDSA